MGSSGDFFSGLLVGKLFSKKSTNSTNEVGCLGQIFGLVIILMLIGIGVNYGIKGIIISLILFVIVIPVLFSIVKRKLQYNKINTEEAWSLYNQNNYTLALEKAEISASKNCDAANLAGVLYLHGMGCDVDKEKAFYYFQLGQKRNMEAKTFYGQMLIEGIGCTQDEVKGKKELEYAANIGKDINAIMKIGEYQVKGIHGWNKDVQNGIKKLRIASDAGNSRAKYLVGRMQFEGIDGVPENKEKGYSLLQEAAELNCSDAIDYLDSIN